MPSVEWREAETGNAGRQPAFIGAQSLHKPAEYDDPDATANANLAARLPYLFASCRFAHYLKCIVRDKIGSFADSETVQTEDRAFLVDFDTRPRLAQATTGDLGLLFRKFAGLTANGFTALYDAIIFSLLQFEETSSRRALVLLSDGDDYKSEYGARKCIQYGRSLGVPVYIIAMGGIHDPRRGMRKIDLEGITEATGGRIHYIAAMADLDDAYGQINRELRSQYILAFSTDQPLSDEQLDSIKLEVPGKKGLKVRTAIGRSTR